MDEIKLDEELLELEGIEKIREEWQKYSFNNNGVPRVTKILAQCENQDFLIQWAANVGRRKYDYYRERAMTIGSIIHEIIDEYVCGHLNDPNFKIDYNKYFSFQPDFKPQIDTAFGNFLLWKSNLEKQGYFIEQVVGVEIPVTCPWFGGTIDAIFKINGKFYLVDFKSSKQISTSYLLQTSAYMWVVNNGYTQGLPRIDGIGIIRVDKNKTGCLDDLFLNSSDPCQNNYIFNFQKCFMSYVDSYYRSKSCDFVFENYYNQYNPLKYER